MPMPHSPLHHRGSLICSLGLLLSLAPLAFGFTVADLFPAIEGWNRPESPRVYTRETLYELIDGAADVYLTFAFDRVTVGYYTQGDTTVTVEIYTFGSERDAYGIYSLERTPSVEFLPIGIQGYYAETVVNCVVGRSYIKCTSFQLGAQEKTVLVKIAESMARTLGGTTDRPRLFSCFPTAGLVRNSERFIAANFLGYPFLHSAYVADYQTDSAAFQLFILEAKDTADCRAMWRAYAAQTGDTGASSGAMTVADPYQGSLSLTFSGSVIIGVIGNPPAASAAEATHAIRLCIPQR